MLLPSQRDWGQNYPHRRRNGLVRPQAQSSLYENLDRSHLSVCSDRWTHPSVGAPDGGSDQITCSSSDLASKRRISFNTPTTPTTSSDGDRFSFSNQAVVSFQCSPDAERELQGIKGTNHDPEYHFVERTYDQNLQFNNQYGGLNDLQPMDLDGQGSISTPIPAPRTIPREEPWSGYHPIYSGKSSSSDMVEEGDEFRRLLSYDCWTHPSMRYPYEEHEQRKLFHNTSHNAYTNNQQHHRSMVTATDSAYQEEGYADIATPYAATSASSGSPVSSTTVAPPIPGRRNGPLSPSRRDNARKMRKQGSCFRCHIMKERCIMDEQSNHDGMCKRCRDISNDYRTWQLRCSGLKLQDRFIFMLPNVLVSQLSRSRIREYIELHVNKCVTGSSFKLALEMEFGNPLELDVVEFIPRGQENDPMLAFGVTTTGSSEALILDNPPVMPLLLDECAIWKHINAWLDSISRETNSNFPKYCFPGAHEHWQREILSSICTYHRECIPMLEANGLGPFQALRRALKLVTLNYIMCHPFTVPEDKVGHLLKQLRRYQPTGSLEWVCPQVVNKIIKSFCLPLLNRATSLVLENLHRILRSSTTKEVLWDQAFSIVFLCLIVVAKNQVALVERAKVYMAKGDESFSMQAAVDNIEKMELELSIHLIGMFHERFSTKKKGNGNGKLFNPLARSHGNQPRSATWLMESIRCTTELHGWAMITQAAELPLSELLSHDTMNYSNVTRLLCTFLRPFAPQDAEA